ncbi:GNAT family protein [Streptomyces sp. NPDC047108]|uniref:GNAT family N-acetyltransferase n=1 Tax=Streptomyces sp. NPDC047108 TaxID=3155025 RepID=UPI0033C2B933
MDLAFRRCLASDADDLVAFLTGDRWPYHSSATVDAREARRWIAEGRFDSDETRSFWVTSGDDSMGLIRLMDLGDDTPLFDLRILGRYRGRGVGARAVAWLTPYLFTAFPEIGRIEGTTRQDNVAMRRIFRRCGYVKEAHYREAWPAEGGALHDAVGYAVLRRDWHSGTVTPPDWNDEAGVLGRHHVDGDAGGARRIGPGKGNRDRT